VPPPDPALRVKAIESLPVEKGIIDSAAMDEVVEIYEHRIGPHNGAKVVVRAWTDLEYKARLLADGSTAIAELGFSGPDQLDHAREPIKGACLR
jgi:nitrile hydratase subunit alpha